MHIFNDHGDSLHTEISSVSDIIDEIFIICIPQWVSEP